MTISRTSLDTSGSVLSSSPSFKTLKRSGSVSLNSLKSFYEMNMDSLFSDTHLTHEGQCLTLVPLRLKCQGDNSVLARLA